MNSRARCVKQIRYDTTITAAAAAVPPHATGGRERGLCKCISAAQTVFAISLHTFTLRFRVIHNQEKREIT